MRPVLTYALLLGLLPALGTAWIWVDTAQGQTAPSMSANEACGPAGEEISLEKKASLKGKAQALVGTNTTSLEGAASTARTEIEVRASRSDVAMELHYLNHISCILIYQDVHLSTDEKLQRIAVLRDTLNPVSLGPNHTFDPGAHLAPATFGLDIACKSIDPSEDVQTILRKFGQQALTNAPSARIASVGKPVIVRPSVGGDDHMGAIPVNTRVRVICTEEDGEFAVIKQEQGSRDGVVESRALATP